MVKGIIAMILLALVIAVGGIAGNGWWKSDKISGGHVTVLPVQFGDIWYYCAVYARYTNGAALQCDFNRPNGGR